jgi:hypothetical protein
VPYEIGEVEAQLSVVMVDDFHLGKASALQDDIELLRLAGKSIIFL